MMMSLWWWSNKWYILEVEVSNLDFQFCHFIIIIYVGYYYMSTKTYDSIAIKTRCSSY